MSEEPTKIADGSDRLDELVRCPFWDVGWCYAPKGFEGSSYKGCIGLTECKEKHKYEWIEYLSSNDKHEAFRN